MRLDDEAERALAALESGGQRRSEAIRDAIVNEARRRTDRFELRREYQLLELDETDRAEMQHVAAVMEDLRAPR